MVYGKLEVYWPGRDGLVESYRLEKAVVAIGRSSGNDVVLDTTSVSRYHISLNHQNDQVFLQDLDSANGTYVDGERATPNEPILLHGGEEILIGDLRLIYNPET
ncbi:MAG: FHA domain-containing protein, partial [Anaerolineae bacterium]|nr:FHA domain-containing protein [Anaerolineae bacterium]